jgi:hypothetical protein
MFVFIDPQGEIVRHVSGREMELYGLLEPCANLHVSQEYLKEQELCKEGECRH